MRQVLGSAFLEYGEVVKVAYTALGGTTIDIVLGDSITPALLPVVRPAKARTRNSVLFVGTDGLITEAVE